MRKLIILAALTAALGFSQRPGDAHQQAGIRQRALAPLPPMGFSSWHVWWQLATEANVRDAAAGLVFYGLDDLGYNIVGIDDGWMAATRDAHGNLQAHATRFPSGIPALISYVKGLGLKFAIYVGRGDLTCYGGAGSYGHEYQDAAQFASWGVDLIKLDLTCGNPLPNTPLVDMQAASTWARALQAAGSNAILIGGTGSHAMASFFAAVGENACRIGADMWPNTWANMSDGFTSTEGIQDLGGPHHWLDLDSLITGQGLTDEESRTQMALWAIQASPLVIGTDIRPGQASAATIATLSNTDIIAVDQDALGIVGRKVSSVACGTATCEVWAKPLTGGACAIGLFNRDSAPHDITASFADVAEVFAACGIGPYATTRDLWTHASLGTLTASYTATAVPAHGAAMIRVAP